MQNLILCMNLDLDYPTFGETAYRIRLHLLFQRRADSSELLAYSEDWEIREGSDNVCEWNSDQEAPVTGEADAVIWIWLNFKSEVFLSQLLCIYPIIILIGFTDLTFHPWFQSKNAHLDIAKKDVLYVGFVPEGVISHKVRKLNVPFEGELQMLRINELPLNLVNVSFCSVESRSLSSISTLVLLLLFTSKVCVCGVNNQKFKEPA